MAGMTATAVANAMDKYYRLHPDKIQFTQHQKTLKHFKARDSKMKGEEYHYKLFTGAGNPVRRGSATSVEESEFPAALTVDHTDVYVDWSNLTEFRGSFKYTGLAAEKTKDLKHAVYQVAKRLIGQANGHFGSVVNMALHQDADSKMACVAGLYDSDGSSDGMTQTTVYVQIDEGSIAQFHPGDVIDIREGTTVGDVQLTATVMDVFETSEGPNGVADIGPGLRLKRLSGGDANFDNVADGDELVFNGDAGSSNIAGFPNWFSYSTAVLSITRTATGSAWSIPYMKDWQSGSADVTFDLETHLGEMAEELAYAVEAGRRARTDEGIKISQAAMILLGTPRLISEAARQVGDAMMTTIGLDKATKAELFGTSGFDGAWWHNALMGPIGFAQDPVATPSTLRLLEPSSWFFITGHEGNHRTVEWLDKDGKRFHYRQGSTGMYNIMTAGALMRLTLANDQPRANFQHYGIKSSLE